MSIHLFALHAHRLGKRAEILSEDVAGGSNFTLLPAHILGISAIHIIMIAMKFIKKIYVKSE